MPEFYMTFARKMNKMPNFSRVWGGMCHDPVSYAYMVCTVN